MMYGSAARSAARSAAKTILCTIVAKVLKALDKLEHVFLIMSRAPCDWRDHQKRFTRIHISIHFVRLFENKQKLAKFEHVNAR